VRNFDKPPLPGSWIPAHYVFGCPHQNQIQEVWPNLEKAKSLNLSLGLLRATVFRPFLGFAGLRRTSQRFTGEKLKLRGSKGDGGSLPGKTRFSKKAEV
jgi:hypothetical protein